MSSNNEYGAAKGAQERGKELERTAEGGIDVIGDAERLDESEVAQTQTQEEIVRDAATILDDEEELELDIEKRMDDMLEHYRDIEKLGRALENGNPEEVSNIYRRMEKDIEAIKKDINALIEDINELNHEQQKEKEFEKKIERLEQKKEEELDQLQNKVGKLRQMESYLENINSS